MLAKLPGYAPPGHKSPNPVLDFNQLEREFESFLLQYHQTEHSQTSEAPQKRCNKGGFLPQLPESIEKLDLLLLTIRDTRRIRRDGIIKKARIAESYYSEGVPVNEIAKSLSISKATLYKYLRFRGVEISPYGKHSS